MTFLCNGSIKTWIFAADFGKGSNTLFTELQIWRENDTSKLYQKVGRAVINTEMKQSRLYHYNVNNSLSFQAGDIVGYYQQNPIHRFLFEKIGYDSGHMLYFCNGQKSAASNFSNFSCNSKRNNYTHALVSVITGKTIAITVFEVLIYHSVLYQIHQIADVVS